MSEIPWFYVDDGFADSKPVVNLPDHLVKVPLRLAACGLWVLAGSWSAKEELDGFVPPSKLRQLGATPTIIRALTEPGPLNAPLCSTEPDPWWTQEWAQDQAQIRAQIGSRSGPNRGPIWVRNWPKWQKTRAEQVAKRKADAEKKRDKRNGQKIKGRNAVPSINAEMSLGDNSGDIAGDDTRDEPGDTRPPVNKLGLDVPEGHPSDTSRARPRGPDPTQTLNGHLGEGTNASSAEPEPPRFCQRHMPSGTLESCGACKQTRKDHERWLEAQSDTRLAAIEAQAAALRDQRRQDAQTRIDAIARCALCDPDGYRNGKVCDHVDRSHTARDGMAAVRAALTKPSPPTEGAE